MKAVIINGGYSVTSRLTGVQQEIIKLLDLASISYEVIQVHKLPAEDLITANLNSIAINNEISLLTDADVVFVLTPIFKGSYSGILKTFLDLLPQKSLENKTVVPVAIGGSIAHLLSLEYSLKPLVSILGATNITNPIYILDQHVKKIENFYFELEEEAKTRIYQVWKNIYKKSIIQL